MPYLMVNILKVAVICAIYGFLFYVARAMRGQVAGPPQTGQPPRVPTAETSPPPGTPPPMIVVRQHDGSDVRHPLDRPLLVGRAADADIRLDDDFASERHARLAADGPRLWVEDLGSTNGTTVDGRAIEGRVEVQRGATVTVGRTKMVFQ